MTTFMGMISNHMCNTWNFLPHTERNHCLHIFHLINSVQRLVSTRTNQLGEDRVADSSGSRLPRGFKLSNQSWYSDAPLSTSHCGHGSAILPSLPTVFCAAASPWWRTPICSSAHWSIIREVKDGVLPVIVGVMVVPYARSIMVAASYLYMCSRPFIVPDASYSHRFLSLFRSSHHW
jgi:hypothetical protein